MSSSPDKKLVIKSKIWIEDEKGKLIFGAGRLRILEAVAQHGSILAASKALKMSYRAAWGKIKETEDRLGYPLLKRQTGGASGGGSELTSDAKSLVERFRRVEQLTEQAASNLFQDFFSDIFSGS